PAGKFASSAALTGLPSGVAKPTGGPTLSDAAFVILTLPTAPETTPLKELPGFARAALTSPATPGPALATGAPRLPATGPPAAGAAATVFPTAMPLGPALPSAALFFGGVEELFSEAGRAPQSIFTASNRLFLCSAVSESARGEIPPATHRSTMNEMFRI